MRKKMISILLAGTLIIIGGCGANRGGEIQLASETPVLSEPPVEVSGEDIFTPPPAPTVEQRLGDAVKDAYPGIEIDAFIRERKAILPGFAVPITIIVKNTGNETIDYVKGSGSYTIPDALFINMEGLQTILPVDRLGIATTDFRTEELNPGEQLEFETHVMAIEPSDQFNEYAMKMYGENGMYIAEQGWDVLQKEFPDLVPAKPESYHGQAYFLYYTRDGAEISDFTSDPTGYAECDFAISVS